MYIGEVLCEKWCNVVYDVVFWFELGNECIVFVWYFVKVYEGFYFVVVVVYCLG